MVEEFNPNANYTPLEVAYPLGSNDATSATFNFRERKKYKEVAYFLDLPTPLDSWYDKLYFGRVDIIQNGIIIKQDTSNLTQLGDTEQNVFVLDFVAQAFNDLRETLLGYGTSGLINTEGTIFYDISAVGGLYNYEKDLVQNRNQLLGAITAWIIGTPSANQRVTDFKSFLEELFDYLNANLHNLPLTLSGYVTSNSSNPMISGLAIELTKDDYGDDYRKLQGYILDPNFRFFVKAARRHGFYVDRNAPWRLIADPLSDPMLEKMTCYQGNPTTVDPRVFFTRYYQRTFHQDIDKLQEDLLYIYNRFVEQHPRTYVVTPGSLRCPFQTKAGTWQGPPPANNYHTTTIERSQITLEDLHRMGGPYWLDLYFKMRLREERITFPNYDKQVQKAVQIYNTYFPYENWAFASMLSDQGEALFTTLHDNLRRKAMTRAARFINNEVKPYLYSKSILPKKDLTKEATFVSMNSISSE